MAEKLSILEERSGYSFSVNSGLRTQKDQMRINPRNPGSAHITGEACDVSDPKGEIWDWVIENLAVVIELGLYMEDDLYTIGWVHFQTRPPKSGKRIFIP